MPSEQEQNDSNGTYVVVDVVVAVAVAYQCFNNSAIVQLHLFKHGTHCDRNIFAGSRNLSNGYLAQALLRHSI